MTELAATRDLMEAVRAELGERWSFSLSWDGADLIFLAREVNRPTGRIGTLEPSDFAKPLAVLAQDIAEFTKGMRQ